jgi:hypothetical protein
MVEQALAHRRSRTRVGNRLRRNRTYALTGSGPLVCEACGLGVKGDTRGRRNGTKIAVYRHRDGPDCGGWPVREVPIEALEEQVAAPLDGATPNRESTARIRAALWRPSVQPDRLAVARLDARLKALAAELVAPDQRRSSADIVAEIERLRAERGLLASRPAEQNGVDPDDALRWLASLGQLRRETSDEGRRHMAVATRSPASASCRGHQGLTPDVRVEATEEAERRELVLALPASIEVTMVGDTGFEPVTSRM